MSHKQQIEFCKRIKRSYPRHFKNTRVVDIGSLDINGNNRRFFKNCVYTGVDLVIGKNVHVTMRGHEYLRLWPGMFDTIISTEALEHDQYWEQTLTAMYDNIKPGGLILITCAGEGRAEHGTKDNHSWCSPATNDYYKNISNEMFGSVLKPDMFETYYLAQDKRNCDLNFYGIKKLK